MRSIADIPYVLKDVPVSKITQSSVKLREVDTDSDKFKELCASVKASGVLNPVLLRTMPDGTYGLIDGAHRFTAAVIAEREVVNAKVYAEDVTDDEVMELQVEANVHKIDTKPVEYTRQIQHIMLKHPERTIEQQAKRFNKSEGWLRDRLSLNLFEGEAQELVNGGQISLANAYALAKIAKENAGEVDDWLDRAQTLPPDQFIPEALKRVEDLKAAKRAGKSPDSVRPTGPAPKLRKLGDIKVEATRAKTSAAQSPNDPFAQGYHAAFAFVLSQDAATVEAWKKAEEERVKQKAERATEREQEKARKAAEGAQLSIADLVKR
jgi:ParB/RepB/Spo0J family partition protein